MYLRDAIPAELIEGGPGIESRPHHCSTCLLALFSYLYAGDGVVKSISTAPSTSSWTERLPSDC